MMCYSVCLCVCLCPSSASLAKHRQQLASLSPFFSFSLPPFLGSGYRSGELCSLEWPCVTGCVWVFSASFWTLVAVVPITYCENSARLLFTTVVAVGLLPFPKPYLLQLFCTGLSCVDTLQKRRLSVPSKLSSSQILNKDASPSLLISVCLALSIFLSKAGISLFPLIDSLSR